MGTITTVTNKNKPALSFGHLATAVFSSLFFCQHAFATGQYETNTRIDPVFGLPVPPVNWDGGGVGIYDPVASGIATWIYVAIFACALVWFWESEKTKSTIHKTRR